MHADSPSSGGPASGTGHREYPARPAGPEPAEPGDPGTAVGLWGVPALAPENLVRPVEDWPEDHRFVPEGWTLSTKRYASEDSRRVWGLGTHVEHELLWSGGGTITVEADGRLWMVPAMLGIWIPAGMPHRVRADRGALSYATFIDPRRRDFPWTGVMGINVSGLLRELLLSNRRDEMPDARRRVIQDLAAELISPVVSDSLDIRLPTTASLRVLAETILADPADDATTEQWAARLGVSGRTLTRAFNRETGLSLTRWRILVRVRAALLDIAAGRPVTAVAARLGYANPSTFIDLFRQVTGHTPAAYFSSFADIHGVHREVSRDDSSG
ncbi:helix-turn-helix domain-containing protein [Mycetocola spongiae]|uniref:helix-turn-helix domain-containing protein n=1 Tax=Mycetocola spongiae TaxID=2859226 RepID=UPI001CF2A778|nr:AraC family transcriptional regulator [Mycetocola spongiae]UCR88895.1 AraC family transcriptional regulator [Mycetocola spongiae]